MCTCLSFILDNPALYQKWMNWAHSLCRRPQSWPHFLPSSEVELLHTKGEGCIDEKSSHVHADHCSDGMLESCGIHVTKGGRSQVLGLQGSTNDNMLRYGLQEQTTAAYADADAHAEDAADAAYSDADAHTEDDADDVKFSVHCQVSESKEQNDTQMMKQDKATKKFSNNSSNSHAIKDAPRSCMDIASSQENRPRMQSPKTRDDDDNGAFSLFTQQGLKGTNQDSMVVLKNFIPSENTTFCGVFDGHGPHGHHISRNVRDNLPAKIASCWQALQHVSLLARKPKFLEKSVGSRGSLDPDAISIWEESFHNAFKLMDRDLLIDEDVDCVFSGTTAVTLVKQGNDLILANVGDSRAVLGVKFDDSLIALQLTVDLTPNLPKEAERIRRCQGRVLALRKEPFVKRVWLPNENSPGLAMARAFGDYALKNYGIISVPEVTHRRISKNDKFVVLATDGVWDVLTNEQVVHIVDAAPVRSLAAEAVVDTAVRAWNVKYPDAMVDDCAVACLFLDSTHPESWQATHSPR